MGCGFVVFPSGGVDVFWDVEPGPGAVIERSVDGGSWVLVAAVPGGEFVFADSAAPGGLLGYRLVLGGDPASSVECVEHAHDVGVSAGDSPLPRLASGEVGASGPAAGAASAVPVSIVGGAPSPDPVVAPELCSVGAHRHSLSPVRDPQVHTRVSIPTGAALRFDIDNVKIPSGDNGNWYAKVELYVANADGSVGARVGSVGWTTPYYWHGATHQFRRDVQFVNNTAGTEFVLRTLSDTVVSIKASTQAYFDIVNARIVNPGTGELVGRPCDTANVEQCRAQGGTVFMAEPMLVDGRWLQGCFAYESCVADLPQFAGFLAGAAEWACENDELLHELLVVAGGAVLVLSGVAVFGASAAALAPLVRGVGMVASPETLAVGVVRGGMTIFAEQGARTGVTVLVAAALTLGGVTAIASGAIDLLADDPTLVPQQLDEDPDGGFDVTPAVIAQMYDRSNFAARYQPSVDPLEQAQQRRAIEAALATCVATIDTTAAQQILDEVSADPPVVDGPDDLFVATPDGQRHLCELIDLYLPGGRHAGGEGAPMSQATLHIRETLYAEPAVTPLLHTGTQPPVPRPEWHFLTRAGGRVDGWYRQPDFNCEASTPYHCDEWPWQSTAQGWPIDPGHHQPHLRIILGAHNSTAGSDLGSFYSACQVGDGEAFVTVPLPRELLYPDWAPTGSVEALRSLRVCAPPR